MSKTKPRIKCPRIESPKLDGWASLPSAFKDASFAHFQQGWQDGEEPAFRPAKAAAAWTGDSLLVYAELRDDDVFNEVGESEFNRLSIDYGDVFEMFFRPSGQESYFEFHVNPNNQKLQLRLPCKEPFKTMQPKFNSEAEMFESFKIPAPPFQSAVKLERGQWKVAAKIQLSVMAEAVPVAPGAEWGFSFCRYDYTRPCKEPVYSSTSPHSAINYHLIDEYGVMEFL